MERGSSGRIYPADHSAIRFGLIGASFSSVLLLPFFTVVSMEMAKFEGRMPILAIL